MSEQINTNTQVQTENMYNFINNAFSNPVILIILLAVIIIYVLLSYSLSARTSSSSSSIPSTSSLGSLSSSSSSSPSSLSTDTNILYSLIILVVIILVLINGTSYIYGLNIMAYVNNLFSSQIDLNVSKKNESKEEKEENYNEIPFLEPQPEVYNISENIFSYDGAKAICKANGSKLASYEQIEDAYNKGGSWCSTGWSKGQMMLFPTSKKVYDKLQKIKGHENDCGREGINGGFIGNPNVKFGANCWGIKPKIKKSEEFLMENQPIYPITPEERIFEKKVEYWKKRLNEILISPFSPHQWSRV